MKVLLLEDHASLREMIGDHLVRQGFVVDAVAHGDEALAAIASGYHDAMILDLGLPDIDGIEVLAAVQSCTGGRMPVLIVTARDGLDSRLMGLNGGADDYIVKPFDLAELEARLRAVLRRPGLRGSSTYICGSLTFDAVSRQASVEGRPLDLSRREVGLLEELLRAAGRVVVKDVLEERLYAFDEPVTRNAVEACVSRLRKKLSSSRAAVRIETKRNIGYRMVAGEDREA